MKLALRACFCFASGLTIATAAHGFGPDNCVSLSRSDAGTCILHTKCGGQDLSKLDFSFDCVSPEKGRETHSLGVGTFDEEEEYDTDLKCQECLPSRSSLLQQKATRKSLAKTQRSIVRGMSLAVISTKTKTSKQHARSAAPSKTVWYGPENCVGAFRDGTTGKCVMVTDCAKDTELDVYEFGLICADKDAELTRHLFGMGTFGRKETFNTDVACEQCLALDEYMDSDKAISKLTDTVKSLKADLESVNEKVDKLSSKVVKEPGASDWVTVATTEGNTNQGVSKETKGSTKFLVRQAQVSQKQSPQDQSQKPSQPAEEHQVVKSKTGRASNLGKDVTGVTDNGHEVQHVKQKASHSKKIDASVQAILAAAVQGAAKRGAVPKKVAQTLAQVASQVPEAQQQQAGEEADTVEVQDDSEQQNQDSQEKEDSKDQKEDQNSQEEAQSDEGQSESGEDN